MLDDGVMDTVTHRLTHTKTDTPVFVLDPVLVAVLNLSEGWHMYSFIYKKSFQR